MGVTPVLRIHFSGLCLFVPNQQAGVAHVLFPKTDVHVRDIHVHRHELWIHWRAGGEYRKVDVKPKHLNATLAGIKAADYRLPEVFDLSVLKPDNTTGCGDDQRGRANLNSDQHEGRILLRGGTARVAPGGAIWTIQDREWFMPTTVTWILEYKDVEALRKDLERLSVPAEAATDEGAELWVLHAPQPEQRPEMVGHPSTSITPAAADHFVAYYPLLLCDRHYHDIPANPKLPTRSGTPEISYSQANRDGGTQTANSLAMMTGTQVNCMVAIAPPTKP